MITKYRGLSISDNNKGQWVYGNLIVDGNYAYIVNGVIECNDQYITIAEWCPVDPKTIGAFTGRVDKNDQEIFEGDVVVVLDSSYTVFYDDKLELEDGTKVTIEESESDCCASAGGEFKNVQLDAVITDVKIGEPTIFDNGDGTTCENTVTIYHNQNLIALAECNADDGNGGYYYSVGSLVIGKIHFPVVEA